MIVTLYWCWVFEQESGGDISFFLVFDFSTVLGAVFTFSFLVPYSLSPCLVLCMGSLSLEFVLSVLLIVSIF